MSITHSATRSCLSHDQPCRPRFPRITPMNVSLITLTAACSRFANCLSAATCMFANRDAVVGANCLSAATCMFANRDAVVGANCLSAATCMFANRDAVVGANCLSAATCMFANRDAVVGANCLSAATCMFANRDAVVGANCLSAATGKLDCDSSIVTPHRCLSTVKLCVTPHRCLSQGNSIVKLCFTPHPHSSAVSAHFSLNWDTSRLTFGQKPLTASGPM